MFHRAVSAIGMRFSDEPNALYGTTDAALLLATMCKEGMCAEQASDILRGQTGGCPKRRLAAWQAGQDAV